MKSKTTNIIFITATFLRLRFASSSQNDIMFSNTAITVESAANVINTKNNEPTILPIGIALNMLDSVVNRKLAPTVDASAVTPLLYVKQAGNTISPDVIATNVSSDIIVIASPVSERSFLILLSTDLILL